MIISFHKSNKTLLSEPEETPICTPVPSPGTIETPEPASLHNDAWGDAELPLPEEKPHSEEEAQQPMPV